MPQNLNYLHETRNTVCSLSPSSETVSVFCNLKELPGIFWNHRRRIYGSLLMPVCVVWRDWCTIVHSVHIHNKRTQKLCSLLSAHAVGSFFSLHCKLGIDTNIHMVFLNLMFALASTEGTCCSISKTLGMREGQASSWHPLTALPGLCPEPLCVFCCVYFRKVI